jgi:hypothetical protein
MCGGCVQSGLSAAEAIGLEPQTTKLISIAAAAVMLFSVAIPAATPATQVKAGAVCTKANQKVVKNGKTFVCKKSGKKLTWKVQTKKPASASPLPPLESASKDSSSSAADGNDFKSPCDLDKLSPPEWNDLVNRFANSDACIGPLRIPATGPLASKPNSAINFKFLDTNICKIKQNPLKQTTMAWPFNKDREVWFQKQQHPSPNTVYQVIPIFTKDVADYGSNPQLDYKRYFDFIRDYTEQASDNGSKVEFRVPDKYFEFPENIASYNISHNRSRVDAKSFITNLSKYIDPKIDFTGANIALIVLPPKTNNIVVEQANLLTIDTKEAYVAASIMPGAGGFRGENNFTLPMWWLHELMHTGIGFDDNETQRIDGMYWWGLVSWASTYDLLTWHKWLAGFISDKQVICLDPKETSTLWLAPSTLRGPYPKMAVLPISSTKVLVLESQRGIGINFKMPRESEGLLAYVVDTSITKSHDGIRLLIPSDKPMIQSPLMDKKSAGKNSNATLRVGEVIRFENISISVVESGEFGDVISINR